MGVAWPAGEPKPYIVFASVSRSFQEFQKFFFFFKKIFFIDWLAGAGLHMHGEMHAQSGL